MSDAAETPKKRLHKLRVRSIDGVDLGAAMGARITLMKRRPQPTQVAKSDTTVTVTVCEDDDEGEKHMEMNEGLAAVMAKLSPEDQKIVETALAEAAKKEPVEMAAQPPAEKKPEDPVAVAKSKLTPELRAAIDDALAKRDAEAIAAKQQLVDVEKRLHKKEEADLDRVFVEKSADIALPGLARAEVAQVLKHLDRERAIPKDLAAKVEKSLRSASALLKDGPAFREVGASGDGASGPESELEAVIVEKRRANPKLSYEQAYVSALEERRDLYSKLNG